MSPKPRTDYSPEEVIILIDNAKRCIRNSHLGFAIGYLALAYKANPEPDLRYDFMHETLFRAKESFEKGSTSGCLSLLKEAYDKVNDPLIEEIIIGIKV